MVEPDVKNFRELRIKRGYTKEGLHRDTKRRVSTSTIRNIESWNYDSDRGPQPDKVRELADVLDVDVPELYDLIREHNPDREDDQDGGN